MCTSLAGCRVSGSRIGLLGTVGTGTVGTGLDFSSLSKTRNVNLEIFCAYDVTRRSVVAHNDRSYARFNSDAYSEVSCGVPYNLSEVSCGTVETWLVEIVLFDLIVPIMGCSPSQAGQVGMNEITLATPRFCIKIFPKAAIATVSRFALS
jgi:hypothetical protein